MHLYYSPIDNGQKKTFNEMRDFLLAFASILSKKSPIIGPFSV